MSMAALPAWWQVTLPHHDIQTHRRLDESLFAADLGRVARGDGPFDYQDPTRFFATTFLTSGLQSLLIDVLRELAGTGSGNRIIQIDTPFGGGKTHTLLALYHLAKSPDVLRDRPGIRELLRDAGLDAVPPAEVATIVGSDLSPAEPVITDDGTRLHTLWGQIAYQLGKRAGYEKVREADERRLAPGADAIRAVLEMGPALILMDELVNYVVGASEVVLSNTTLKDQTIAFLQQLTTAVAQTARTVLVLTIPSSMTELYGEAAHDLQQQAFQVAGQIGSVVGRVQTVRTPVQGDDIYEVLRRRLLERPKDEQEQRATDATARRVAEAYVAMYRANTRDVPQEVQEPAYVERMVRAYPFHPDVVRILYERWGTLPDFQRTRGALRILGMTLADLFTRNRADALILPAHLNLAPGDLRNELLRVVGNPTYNSVLDSDVAGPNAKTAEIDRGMGQEHARFTPALRAATTIFLWSFTGAATETRGATEAQIRVGMLEPEMQPAIVGNVLNEFRRRLWYLHEENGTYRFDTQANLNRVIVQKEDGVTGPAAAKLVEEQVRSLVSDPRVRGGSPLFGGASVTAPADARPYLFPKESNDVADIPATGIVLLHSRNAAPAGTDAAALPSLVSEILHYSGVRPRQNRNALVVLVPDTALVAEAEKAAKHLLALRAAIADTQIALPDRQRRELDGLRSDAERAFPQECGRIYRSVVIPADKERGGMERFDLGLRPFSAGATLWDDAFSYLAANDHYLTSLAPMLLLGDRFGIWPKALDYSSTQRLWDAFVQFPHLPLLAGKQVLVQAIERGATEGTLGYAVGDEAGPPFAQGRFGSHNPGLLVEIASTSFLTTPDYARAHFVPQTDPVHDIPPEMLVDASIWPQGSQRRSLQDIWRDLAAHYAPQPIAGPEVLVAAVMGGMAKNLFRVVPDGASPEDAEMPAYSQLIARTGLQLVRTSTKPIGPGPARFLTINVSGIAPGQVSKIMSGAVLPLINQGATVTLRIIIDADAPNGVDSTVLNLTIKETFNQLGLTPTYEQQ